MEFYEARKLIKCEVFEDGSSASRHESPEGCGKYALFSLLFLTESLPVCYLWLVGQYVVAKPSYT